MKLGRDFEGNNRETFPFFLKALRSKIANILRVFNWGFLRIFLNIFFKNVFLRTYGRALVIDVWNNL